MDIGRHARVAQCAHKYGVEVAGQHLETVRWKGGAVREVALSAPVETW